MRKLVFAAGFAFLVGANAGTFKLDTLSSTKVCQQRYLATTAGG